MYNNSLVKKLIADFELGVESDHGPIHWARVLEIGLELAKETGADTDIVALFAIFHDCARINEWGDPGHGKRGAAAAKSWRGTYSDIPEDKFRQLEYACANHTDGLVESDPTIGTCWDADRLDLPRVGTIPSADRLCTIPAKSSQVIRKYRFLSETGYIPEFVLTEWLA
jgi:uncharacterized protein